MNTLDQHTHSITGVAIAMGLIALAGGAAFIFFPDFIDMAFDKVTDYLTVIPGLGK